MQGPSRMLLDCIDDALVRESFCTWHISFHNFDAIDFPKSIPDTNTLSLSIGRRFDDGSLFIELNA